MSVRGHGRHDYCKAFHLCDSGFDDHDLLYFPTSCYFTTEDLIHVHDHDHAEVDCPDCRSINLTCMGWVVAISVVAPSCHPGCSLHYREGIVSRRGLGSNGLVHY